jgi:hypothetical protein
MRWEILGGIAAGLNESKRRAKRERDLDEYRKAAKDLYSAQADRMRRYDTPSDRILPVGNPSMQAGEAMGPPESAAMPAIDPMRSDIGADEGGVGSVPYADGGMVGSEVRDWHECYGEASHYWQKQSFKK